MRTHGPQLVVGQLVVEHTPYVNTEAAVSASSAQSWRRPRLVISQRVEPMSSVVTGCETDILCVAVTLCVLCVRTCGMTALWHDCRLVTGNILIR